MESTLTTEIVAIDGPAGAGKSTVARKVAEVLGYAFLDTGAMYRAATWLALTNGVDLDDAQALANTTRSMNLDLREVDGRQQVLVGDEDITHAIRTPEVTRQISKLDHNPEVRAHLVALQQAFGARRPTVAEGRDIGTVVFPHAKCKIYLDASLEERTRRRALEFEKKGIAFDSKQLMEDIRQRDHRDMSRSVGPLKKADDAVVVETDGLTPDEVVDRIVRLAKERA
ncbi:MAG: (d)CMP kinase [Candidatus Hydrogenedentes bacterium]|nr:(d)CMP kinase [Candidatus Hydrogenedentota bacterium]